MSVFRVVFLGTPAIAESSLRALWEDEHFQVVGVLTQPDRPAGRKMKRQPSPVKVFAEQHGIPVLTPEKASAPEMIEQVRSWGAECAAVVAFGQILRSSFLDLFPKRIVNVHASLLPRWRGAAPIQRALMEGDPETGVCLQVMQQKLDAGAIIGSRKIVLDNEINALQLHDRMISQAQSLLTLDFVDYLKGNVAPEPQDESLVTYAAKLEKSEASLNWEDSAKTLHNHVRGMVMGPGSHTLLQGQKIKILKTRAHANEASALPGEVVRTEKDSIWVATGEGVLQIFELQPASKARMPVRSFLAGHELKNGDRFGK